MSEGVNYCWLKRKNKLPAGGVMVMKLFVLSLEGLPLGVQLVVLTSGLCCKVQPVRRLFQYGQETVRALPESVMANCGIGVARNP